MSNTPQSLSDQRQLSISVCQKENGLLFHFMLFEIFMITLIVSIIIIPTSNGLESITEVTQ